MARKKKPTASEMLSEIIIKGIEDKKGMKIVKMNLSSLKNSITDYFIICSGTSRPHTEAIASSVEKEVKTAVGLNPWHKEGLENAEWILIDYIDVVVHIFQEKSRDFYQLEQVWGDADIQYIDN